MRTKTETQTATKMPANIIIFHRVRCPSGVSPVLGKVGVDTRITGGVTIIPLPMTLPVIITSPVPTIVSVPLLTIGAIPHHQS